MAQALPMILLFLHKDNINFSTLNNNMVHEKEKPPLHAYKKTQIFYQLIILLQSL